MLLKALSLGGSARAVSRANDELQLCKRIAGGEQHLFAGIVDRYSALVAGAVTAHGVPSADVEDVAQICFVSVYKGLGGFRGEAKLSSWIYRIAINTARAYLRRQSRRISAHSVEEALESGQQPVDERGGPAMDSNLYARSITNALAQLGQHQRSCLTLYYFEELSYEEIAEALALNLNTVRTHIRRGKQRLAELLDESLLDAMQS